jgi:ABC-type bacteriocin/lantibiotic exporter with double-glycine peptidase domain
MFLGMATDDSFLANLKNTVAYKAHSAVYDPKANEFAQQQAQKKAEDEKKKKEQQQATTDNTTQKTNGDPNTFSAVRLAKTTGSQVINILQQIFFPFLSLMLAMIVTNEMIVYSAPIRLIFFIFTFLVCYLTKVYAIVLAIFYLLKGGYSYYYNNLTGKPKKDIMPSIFALLPLTTYKPLSSFAGFFMYPFTYPKTEKGAQKLPEIMKNYYNSLVESFNNFDAVKSLPTFAKDIQQIKKDLDQMHSISVPTTNSGSNSNSSDSATATATATATTNGNDTK